MNGEQAIIEIHRDIKSLEEKVSDIATGGCAKREGDIHRIEAVEDSLKSLGQKMDKIFYATLVTAGGIIVFLLKAFLPYVIK